RIKQSASATDIGFRPFMTQPRPWGATLDRIGGEDCELGAAGGQNECQPQVEAVGLGIIIELAVPLGTRFDLFCVRQKRAGDGRKNVGEWSTFSWSEKTNCIGEQIGGMASIPISPAASKWRETATAQPRQAAGRSCL